MTDYPEHDKLRALGGANQTVGDFIEWAREQGVHLMRYVVRDYDEPCNGGLFNPYDCEGGKQVRVYDEQRVVTERLCRNCEGKGVVTVHREGWEDAWPHTQGALADYFEIDQDKIEQEKRAMLASLRGEDA